MTCEFTLNSCPGNTHWDNAVALRGCFSLNWQCTFAANLLIIFPYASLLHTLEQFSCTQNIFIYNENTAEDKLWLPMKYPGLGAGWTKPTLKWVERGHKLLSISCVTLNLLLQSQHIWSCRYITVICSSLQLLGEEAVISTILLHPPTKEKSILFKWDFHTISRFSFAFKWKKTKKPKNKPTLKQWNNKH